ncbi:L-ribulose-5-phosphate 3-epimerase [Aequitasia blattaphilus]|uniref:L-ribulose-5-phosphate 3-epimerase n=1 Tax=Aequitasia blattaphilus TaxID=2949332 RepID=A0ABT1EAV8_9FIRM|nr:L-ribulose-5-phosphate 3-epimerase [Aequitasia blattaphilus]MCP1102973.1 L-ribulose-5-phosphate 3-epimerase [Aequitasia blattaphilus]MCR8615613.1 L-ribulose-5-phosphate 3-epimerase [Aequitasia blattaphilus]
MKAYTLGLYEKSMPPNLGWREKLMYTKQAGFDFLEISIDETDEKLKRLDMTQEERAGLLSITNGIDLPIRTMCLSGHRKYPIGSMDDSIAARGMEIMEKAIRLAEDLGIRIIQLAGYDVYYEESTKETKERFAGNLKKAAEMAAGAGVVLGFETMETEFMNTVEKAMHYVNQVNSSYLNVYPDLGNITNAAYTYETSVEEDLETGRGHLSAMHLKETIPGVFREVPFGTGHVDFERGIKKAWELGIRKYVTEFWYTGNETWKDDLSYASQMMREILNRQVKERQVA